MKTTHAFAVLLLTVSFARESWADGLYTNAHDLQVEAIRQGDASGVMSGDIAKRFAEQFKSNGVLLVEAKKLITYKQPGCARIGVNYTKKDVPTGQGFTTVRLTTQINYCIDGRPPYSLEQAP